MQEFEGTPELKVRVPNGFDLGRTEAKLGRP